LHVHMYSATTAPIQAPVLSVLEKIWQVHKELPAPKQQGRIMAVPANNKA